MVTVLSGVSTSLMIGGPEDEYIRMCSGLAQHHHQQQQPQLVRNHNHNNPYSNGMAPSHRYNAKASAIVHRCQMKNIHMRSQSMPEDAYIKYNLQQQQIQQHPAQMYHNQAQQQQQHLSQQQQNMSKLEKRMSFANPSAGTSNVNLKRSQTNAADLGARLSAVQHFVNERQRFEASTNSLNTMAARSRSNIAALNWNFGESELYTSRVPNNNCSEV